MVWAIVILIVIIAAIAVPNFGKSLLAIVGLIALLIAFYVYNEKAEAEASRKRIAPTELQITNLALAPHTYGSSYRLTGRLKNTSSKYTVQKVILQITIKDCITPDNCEIVGDTSVSIWGTVPPQQTRALNENAYFTDLPAFRGKWKWTYAIIEVQAPKPRNTLLN